MNIESKISVNIRFRSIYFLGLGRDWEGHSDWEGIGKGLGRDWEGIGKGIGKGLGRDWEGIGKGLGRLVLMFLKPGNFHHYHDVINTISKKEKEIQTKMDQLRECYENKLENPRVNYNCDERIPDVDIKPFRLEAKKFIFKPELKKMKRKLKQRCDTAGRIMEEKMVKKTSNMCYHKINDLLAIEKNKYKFTKNTFYNYTKFGLSLNKHARGDFKRHSKWVDILDDSDGKFVLSYSIDDKSIPRINPNKTQANRQQFQKSMNNTVEFYSKILKNVEFVENNESEVRHRHICL